MTPSKHEAYERLVAARKACKRCRPRLANPAYIAEGHLDSAEIGPYSRWQGNLYAPIVVVGQDLRQKLLWILDQFQAFQRIEKLPPFDGQ